MPIILMSNALAGDIKFTYLDIIDPSIIYEPVFVKGVVSSGIMEDTSMSSGVSCNSLRKGELSYSLFSFCGNEQAGLPGYEGKRCIIDIEIALKLSEIQNEIVKKGYSLKVLDAYRPQQAVDYLAKWKEEPEEPIFKKLHHPSVSKSDLGTLSYLASRSSHSRGVAVDLTMVKIDSDRDKARPKDFLGIWDPKELDMGNVGFLAFDEKSGHAYTDRLEKEQADNRNMLLHLMWGRGFRKLRSEFWHYFLDMERNTDHFYDFVIRDDYKTDEKGVIIIPKE